MSLPEIRARVPRYYVKRVMTTMTNKEGEAEATRESIVPGSSPSLFVAWEWARAYRRAYPDMIFVAGELCTEGW
jgi:hypothetical protein